MSAPEKRWLAAATLAALVIVNIPFVVGFLTSAPDRLFSGALLEREDVFSYLAKMRVGAGGGWLMQNMYAVEPHPEVPLYSVYLFLGHIASPGGDPRVPLSSLLVTFTAARLVFGAGLLVVLYWVISLFTQKIVQRQLAWGLIVFGGGLGWLLMLVTGKALPFGSPPLDLYLGEAVTTVPLMAYPHALLARSALLAGIVCLARADDLADWRWAAAAGGCWLVATLGVPFDILSAGGIVGGWIAVRWLMTRKFPRQLALMGLAAGLPGSAFDLVTLAMIGNDPVYASWAAQNTLPLPHIAHLLSAFGVQAGLAVPAAIALWRKRSEKADLLIGWVVAVPLLTLIPLPFQLRLVESLPVPLWTLAVIGLQRIFTGRRRLAATVGLWILVLPTSLLLIIGGAASAMGGFGSLSQDQVAMFDWLRTRAESRAVTLASADTGVAVPAFAPLRSALGHGFETPDFDRTEAATEAFYRGEMNQTEALAWLESLRVRYVIVGPDEALLSGTEPGAESHPPGPGGLPLKLVFSQGGYQIYEMVSP